MSLIDAVMLLYNTVSALICECTYGKPLKVLLSNGYLTQFNMEASLKTLALRS